VVVFVGLIHHTANSLRAVTIIERIADETRGSLAEACATDQRVARRPGTGSLVSTVVAVRAGTITDVDLDEVAAEADRVGMLAEVVQPVGSYVCRGQTLVRLYEGIDASGAGPHGDGTDPRAGRDRAAQQMLRHVHLAAERTMRSDPGFGVRQLVDIAERALSPGVNDPTTAVQCLDRIHDLLRDAAARPMPPLRVSTAAHRGAPTAWMPAVTFGELLDLGLDELRHWGSGSIQVHRRLEALIADLLDVCRCDRERHAHLLLHRELLRARRADLPSTERARVDVPSTTIDDRATRRASA
jgi:uncharacterized membrane protein